jgi:hypothetical protein
LQSFQFVILMFVILLFTSSSHLFLTNDVTQVKSVFLCIVIKWSHLGQSAVSKHPKAAFWRPAPPSSARSICPPTWLQI